MPLTSKEQKRFESRFGAIQGTHPDSKFLEKLGDVIFEMTGNVNLKMRMFHMSERLAKKGK